jgi:hypothetical protein
VHKVEKSINDIFKLTGISRRTLSNLLKFNRDVYTIKEILSEINFLLDNPHSFSIEKVEYKGKRFNSVVPILKKSINIKDISISSSEAFDYELELKDSILNCDEEQAYERGLVFLNSWLKFNKISTFESVEIIKTSERGYIINIRNSFEELLASA